MSGECDPLKLMRTGPHWSSWLSATSPVSGQPRHTEDPQSKCTALNSEWWSLAAAEGAWREAAGRRTMSQLPTAMQQIISKLGGWIPQETFIISHSFGGSGIRAWFGWSALAWSLKPCKHVSLGPQSSEGLTEVGVSPCAAAHWHTWQPGAGFGGRPRFLPAGASPRGCSSVLRIW